MRWAVRRIKTKNSTLLEQYAFKILFVVLFLKFYTLVPITTIAHKQHTNQMSLKIPPELKKVTQYIRRAEELDKEQTKPESRLVAYYCRQVSSRF